jgi:hypothetical protein
MQQGSNIPPQQEEPTVLDLYKSVTKNWESFFNFIRSLWDVARREQINQTLVYATTQTVVVEPTSEPIRTSAFPWKALAAFLLALIAQAFVEPPQRQSTLSVILYLTAIGLALWSYRTNELHLANLPNILHQTDPLYTRLIPLIISVIFAGIAFVDFGDGLFTSTNVALWVLSLLFLGISLWVKTPKIKTEPDENITRKEFNLNGILISIPSNIAKKWTITALTLLAFGIAIFFRLSQLDTVPIEPFSDHAEKILDVYEITQGQPHIFFERNTGREAFQFYWTLLVLNVFDTGFTFFSLKLGTALLGILTLPFVYQLGKEYGNERVAIIVLFLFGIAAWPNIISRIGLRFPLYPLFVAPTLLYLTRGLRTHNRNDFILAGLFLGIGLHGYSPFRMMPILVVVAFILYLLHLKSKEKIAQAVWWFLIIIVVSIFVFSPLLRYSLENPDSVGYRALTRLSGVENPLPGPAWQIFLSNLYNGLLMFNWDDGEIWVNSVTHRPALDFVTAAFFVMGVVLIIARYIRQRDWRDLLLLISVPLLIMPSVLSLAFPGENPAINRAGGASVVVILMAALAVEGFITSFGSGAKRKIMAYSVTGIMFLASAYSNYDIVFDQFYKQFKQSAWNTSEIGRVIKDFENEYGQTETVWVVPYPHWVDTRLPGVWAGVPNRDFALFPEFLPDSLAYAAPKMFIYWHEDTETERILKQLYPNGELTRYTSSFENKDFFIYFVKE